MNTKCLDNVLLALVIVGAVNWGLIGFFRFDLIAFIFGNMSWISRIIYALVGISGLYLISVLVVSDPSVMRKHKNKYRKNPRFPVK